MTIITDYHSDPILGPRQQVRDNNKQRHHGDGAVYFMRSMTPVYYSLSSDRYR